MVPSRTRSSSEGVIFQTRTQISHFEVLNVFSSFKLKKNKIRNWGGGFFGGSGGDDLFMWPYLTLYKLPI